MKSYKGTAKVKDDSFYIYKGQSFDIIGYKEYKGHEILSDGTRNYKFSLVGTEFEEKHRKSISIYDSHLEDIKLFETIELPLTEEESIKLIQFSLERVTWNSYEEILEAFIIANTKELILPIVNY